jgi:hypothetical protein
MYDHDEENPFDRFMEGNEGPSVNVNLQLPQGETLIINGVRTSPTIIQVVKTAERNPKRDARMLAVTLSTSLDEATLVHLAEYLYMEHLVPIFQEQKDLFNSLYLKDMKKPEEFKKKPPKKKPEQPEDET